MKLEESLHSLRFHNSLLGLESFTGINIFFLSHSIEYMQYLAARQPKGSKQKNLQHKQ